MKTDKETIYVSSPLMPEYEEYVEAIRGLWESRMLTNNGVNLRTLEKAIGEYLGEEFVSIYTNGTLPIIAACHALNLKGEVITTPYTFIATAHALRWSNLQPVFADVDPFTGNLNPEKIEALITKDTCAILPVHVYGQPCDTNFIGEIANRHGLSVIYDAAHAFGVRKEGKSITHEGTFATLSFHATKVFNTLEGGAIICKDEAMKEHLDRLRNFGFKSETEITTVGINAKMDEMRAIYGLLNLKKVNEAISYRKQMAECYVQELQTLEGLTLPNYISGIDYNYSHFPILFKDKESREKIYNELKRYNIYSRRYFYPLVTHFAPYNKCKGADNIPVASDMSERVLCLPIHTNLSTDDVHLISQLIAENIR